MYASSEQPEFRPALGLLPTNIEMEEAVLGGILLDPNAIERVIDILPVQAFYIDSHKDIYQAALALYKQGLPTDLLSVIGWLADHDLLHRVGGRNKLVSLVDRTVSAANIDVLADALQEKYCRRQLDSIGIAFQNGARDTEKPLAWVMEKLENLTLQTTQMRKQDSKGYWHKWDQTRFQRLCKDLEEVEEIENAAQRDWAFRKLAKKWKFGNKKELLDFHAKWLDSQEAPKKYDTNEYFRRYGQSEQNWLIPGFIPADSVVVLYADGGVGKTRLAMSLAKAAVTGGTFAYEGTEFEPMKTLLIETDQGPRNTAKLLEMQGFLEDGVGSRLTICDEWSFGEFGRLKSMLKDDSPKLVILDSLTSLSINSLYSENDTEYARPLVRLRHLAKEFGCTFLVIHHSNAQGGIRGTRAIKNTVDEVFKFTKQQNELGEFNVLTIEKTRSRGPGNYKFTYDDDTWGWKFGGLIEEEFLGGSNGTTNMMRCINFLTQNKGTPYQAIEVAEALGLPKDSVRRDLRRAATEGLVNSGRSTTNKCALVYYVGVRKQVLSNAKGDQGEQIDQIEPISPITSLPPQNPVFGKGDQMISKSSPCFFPGEVQNSCPPDHLITPNTSDLPEATDSKANEQNEEVICGMVSEAIAPEKNVAHPCGERSPVTSLNKESLTDLVEANSKKDDHSLPEPRQFTVDSKLGESTVTVTPLKKHKKHFTVRINYVFADGSTKQQHARAASLKEAKRTASQEITRWQNETMFKLTYRVGQISREEDKYIWVENCKLVSLPNPPVDTWYTFESPEGTRLRVAGDDEFEVHSLYFET